MPRPFLRRTCLAAPILLATATSACTANAQKAQDERMAWWRDARFGMFIHWGLYAIPAGKWADATNHGEWIRDSARIPVATYDELQAKWNPERFDAGAWAKMAADAGMKYLVVTSKHHDGFCLWDSAATDWDVGGTPGKRDILRELADACARHGVVFCTYHSIMDWHHPDYLPRRPWEAATRPAVGADLARFEKYLHTQVTEVVQRYEPAVMWFDGEWEPTWSHERGVRLFELCRSLAPRMIVNNRVDVHRGGMGGFSASAEAVGDFATPEQEIPATGLPGVDWESCMTMNDHWGFNAADANWKSAKELVRNLIDIASKGGNYLLNVGPRADGTFPPEAVERLAAIGAWMKKNGEAIHGTTASVFDDLPWGRCTVKAGDETSTLYLHVFDEGSPVQLVLPGLVNEVRSARVLGEGTVMPMVFEILPGPPVHGFHLGRDKADPIATVVAVEIAGRPLVVRKPSIQADGDQFVSSVTVRVDAGSEQLPVHVTVDGTSPTAQSPRGGAPLVLTSTTTVKARAFHGKSAGAIAERTFTKVDPLPPVKVLARTPGLRVERFAGDWRTIPTDLDTRTPESTTTSATVTLPPAVGERVLLSFRGFVDVPADELYRFELTSDDGSRLWIDGKLVADNDGLHGPVTKDGAIALAKGLHAIHVVWFNRTGDVALGLKWATPGQPFAPLPAEALRH